LNGIMFLAKPPGITSFQALGALKKKLETGKVGHAGTLDKFATGLLIAAAGNCTRLLPFFMAEEKEYLAQVVFGTGTDTLDPEGAPTTDGPVPARDEVERVLQGFRGEIMQRPPEYSAVHVNGVRAWRAARQGVAVNPPPRPVRVSSLILEDYTPPRAVLRVVCSRGTYIRALARDMAAVLGTCAHLGALERQRIGRFTLGEAVAPDDFDPDRHLLAAGAVVGRLTGITMANIAADRESDLRSGKGPDDRFFTRPLAPGLNAALDGDGRLVAVVNREAGCARYMMVLPE
jgi:tRNA pseudouridine55 synthase